MEAFFKWAGGTSEPQIVSFVELFEGISLKCINMEKEFDKTAQARQRK